MRLLRNSAWTLAATVLPTLLSIITLPLFVGAIGPGRYGVLAIAWIVLGYFGSADFGIGRAITQRISAMQGEGRAAMASAVWSALISMALFGLVGAALIYASTRWYFGGPFAADPALRAETLAALWALALCNPVVAISGVLSGALTGLERFRLVSAANMASGTAVLVLPLALALAGRTGLSGLILAALAGRLIGAAVLGWGVWRTFLRGQRARFAGQEFRRLANFGAWIMVTALVGPFMVFADRFVIGAVESAAAVAAYAIPFQIASRTQMLPMAITQALFPRFAAETAAGSAARVREFTAFVALMFAPVIVGLICLAGPLLALWLGDTLDPRSVVVGQVVLAGFWINAVALVPYGFIQARGAPRFTALLHLAEFPFYVLALFVLGREFGLAGCAAAFSLRCAADCAALCRRAGAADGFVLLRIAVPGLLVGLALAVGAMVSGWLALLALGTGLGAAAVIALLVLVPETIRARLVQLPILRAVLPQASSSTSQ